MRSRWTRVIMFLVLTISMLATVACGTSSTQVNTTSTSSQVTTTSSSTQTTSTTTSSQTLTPPPTSTAPEVLKIGLVCDFSSPTAIDGMHAIDALVERDNKAGGWNIGGKNYQVQFVEYDSSANDQATSASAINRLISLDKVKFILDLGNFANSDLPITESNHVINFNLAIFSAIALAPNNHYSYSAAGLEIGNAAFWGWLVKNYSLISKKLAGAFIDNQFGHFIASVTENNAKGFGVTLESIFYPAGTQDFSAAATKVVSMNPDLFTTASGNDQNDAIFYNTVRQAGYKGVFFSQISETATVLGESLSPEALEGFVCRANATEFSPPLTQTAKDVINIWTAKYGSWTDPLLSFLPAYFMVKAALEQAGSLDVDKVVAVLNSGMKYDTMDGPSQMFSRPDLGNDRTVDSAFTQYVKIIKNGKLTLLATISTADAIANFRIAFPPLPPGPPPGPPPG